MKIDYLDFKDIPQLSTRDRAYQANDSKLRPFYTYDFEFEKLKDVISTRETFPINRTVLVGELQRQYKDLPGSTEVSDNITALKEDNCFTVVTAHQPSLFTGPLYFILKICSAINLARRLNNELVDQVVVPVFILGGEDHDFEEINHTYIYGKKVSWDREASGSVGRLSLENLEQAISTITQILGESPRAEELKAIILQAKKRATNYGHFARLIVDALFSKYGLVVINFDSIAFKKEFVPLIKREILEGFSKDHILQAQTDLTRVGFSDQAYAREINFFYLHDGQRLRLERENDVFSIVDSDTTFTKAEIIAEIEKYPERFSPNVIMRPLYQELILPNLAYIGGGGELAYWMERKSQFADAKISFPMLIRRNSALWINKRNVGQMVSLDVDVYHLMQETEQLVKDYAVQKSVHEVDFTEPKQEIERAYATIVEKSIAIDGSLRKMIDAMKTNNLNGIEKLEGRLLKAMKSNQEVTLNKLRKLKESLFPGEGLQERNANFMEFYLSNGQEMLDFLVNNCDPFEKKFLVFTED